MSSLDDVTLVVVETKNHALATQAIQDCMAVFPIKRVTTFSDQVLLAGARHVPIRNIATNEDLADFTMKCMWPFIETTHALFLPWDSRVLNPDLWTNDFLEYDHISLSRPWQQTSKGRMGMQLRSRKLMDAMRYPTVQATDDYAASDQHSQLLERKFGIKFATNSVTKQFIYDIGAFEDAFSARGFWNLVRFSSKESMEYYINNRPNDLFADSATAYRIIEALSDKGRLDLVEDCAADIQSGEQFDLVVSLIQQNPFNNQAEILDILTRGN